MRAAIVLLPILLLVSCAAKTKPAGPMTVIIHNPFNILTGGVFEAPVETDGSFANGTRQGNSSIALFGQVTPGKRGSYEVTFDYQCCIARAPSVVDTKSLHATVITGTNDAQAVGDILITKKGRRNLGAADDISFELREEEQ